MKILKLTESHKKSLNNIECYFYILKYLIETNVYEHILKSLNKSFVS